jgi:hypothetical protein
MAAHGVRRHVEPVGDAVQHVAAQELAVDVDELRVRADRAGAGHLVRLQERRPAALQLRGIAGNRHPGATAKSRPAFAATTTSFPDVLRVFYCSFAYSALACFRAGTSGFPRVRTYALAVDASSPECFVGASAINTTPMTTRTADPTRNPTRWLAISSPSMDIATACAKLDHVAKAIRLRFADGLPTARK